MRINSRFQTWNQTHYIYTIFEAQMGTKDCKRCLKWVDVMLPPFIFWTAAGEVNNSSSLINIQTVCECQGLTIYMWCNFCSSAPIGLNNNKAHVSISNVKLARLHVEAQSKWTATDVFSLGMLFIWSPTLVISAKTLNNLIIFLSH